MNRIQQQVNAGKADVAAQTTDQGWLFSNSDKKSSSGKKSKSGGLFSQMLNSGKNFVSEHKTALAAGGAAIGAGYLAHKTGALDSVKNRLSQAAGGAADFASNNKKLLLGGAVAAGAGALAYKAGAFDKLKSTGGGMLDYAKNHKLALAAGGAAAVGGGLLASKLLGSKTQAKVDKATEAAAQADELAAVAERERSEAVDAEAEAAAAAALASAEADEVTASIEDGEVGEAGGSWMDKLKSKISSSLDVKDLSIGSLKDKVGGLDGLKAKVMGALPTVQTTGVFGGGGGGEADGEEEEE